MSEIRFKKSPQKPKNHLLLFYLSPNIAPPLLPVAVVQNQNVIQKFPKKGPIVGRVDHATQHLRSRAGPLRVRDAVLALAAVGSALFTGGADRAIKHWSVLKDTHSTHSASAALALSSVWAGGAYTGT